MSSYELNMDGLVGPTHHYAGLSAGNIASTSNAHSIANPAAAALQGIQKMRLLHQLGIKQALLPPQQRPNLHLLHQLGFTGSSIEQIDKARRADPNILSACFSASSMWTANAATISPSIDTIDKRVHFTAANLISNLHRHQEADFSSTILQTLFADNHYFQHHTPLPRTTITSDEGAANHNRLCENHSNKGIHLFVYGKKALPANNTHPAPVRYPARQTLEASQAIARLHGLDINDVIFACQNPSVIDQGVFHNDVIAVANESVLFIHEEAFLNQRDVLTSLTNRASFPIQIIEVSSKRISVADAVKSYLFNSQLITLPGPNKKKMALIAPSECEHLPTIRTYIDEIISDDSNPISHVYFMDLKQSMKNGGGPACLRLRVVLNDNELSAMNQHVLVNNALLDELDTWIKRYYRTKLHADDLSDPYLVDECYLALDTLTTILKLGSIYPFQSDIKKQPC